MAYEDYNDATPAFNPEWEGFTPSAPKLCEFENDNTPSVTLEETREQENLDQVTEAERLEAARLIAIKNLKAEEERIRAQNDGNLYPKINSDNVEPYNPDNNDNINPYNPDQNSDVIVSYGNSGVSNTDNFGEFERFFEDNETLCAVILAAMAIGFYGIFHAFFRGNNK